MTKQKILVSKQVPPECLTPYLAAFSFTLPENAPAFTYEEIVSRIPEFDGFFDIDVIADKPLFDAAKKLKAIANYGVGYDKIDWKYATELGVPVLNTPTQVTEATAELAVALMMAVMRGISLYDREVRAHTWHSPLFSDKNTMIFGSTLGIVGFGRIGKAVCRKARGLGMDVIYYDKIQSSPQIEAEYGAAYRPFDALLAQSDCVTLHAPYFPESHHMFNEETFRKMKPSSYFINAARGRLVDEAALCQALQDGVIKGAGLDVFEDEPTVYPGLLALDNVVMTPHAGSLTMRSRIGMCNEALQGLTAVLNGETPANIINPSVLKGK